MSQVSSSYFSVSTLNNPPSRLKGIGEKTLSIVRRCFEALLQTLTFPLRFLGSKTWSIPGLILRTPFAIFKRLISKSDLSLKDELLGTGYHFGFEKTPTKEELKPYYPHACATAFSHSGNSKHLLKGLNPITPKTLNLPAPYVYQYPHFFNPTTGLRALIVEKENDWIVSFAHLQPKNGKSLVHPFGSDVALNFVGSSPSFFEEASQFVASLKEVAAAKGKNISLTGLCYGGLVASYVALKQKIPAVCFNSLPMGLGVQKAIGDKVLRTADQYILHIACKNDWIMDLPFVSQIDRLINYLGIRTIGNFGRTWMIPTLYPSRMESHVHYLRNTLHHIGLNPATKPADQPL